MACRGDAMLRSGSASAGPRVTRRALGRVLQYGGIPNPNGSGITSPETPYRRPRSTWSRTPAPDPDDRSSSPPPDAQWIAPTTRHLLSATTATGSVSSVSQGLYSRAVRAHSSDGVSGSGVRTPTPRRTRPSPYRAAHPFVNRMLRYEIDDDRPHSASTRHATGADERDVRRNRGGEWGSG
jgi:hypothetical protein